MEDFFYILKNLEIPHSYHYTSELFLNQASNRTLWGIKQLLEKYGVKVTAVKVESKSIDKLSYPFVYQTQEGFYAMTGKPEAAESFEKEWKTLSAAQKRHCNLQIWPMFRLCRGL